MKDIEGEVLTNVQNQAGVPSTKTPLETMGLKLDDIEGYALKKGVAPAEKFVDFLAEDFSDEPILMEKQARLAWDWIKMNKAEEGEEIDTVTFKIVHGTRDKV